MKLDELWYKYQGKRITGSGEYKITFTYKGKEISCRTNNTLAIDRLSVQDILLPRKIEFTYTEKQALQSLYDECKRKNKIH